MTPENPFAGRDVTFVLSGLTPWQPVTVSFIDPQGIAATWITPEDVNLLGKDDVKATSFTMYPTTSGEVTWERFGVRDEAGDWSVSIDLDGILSPTVYSMGELQLIGLETVSVGAELTRYSGSDSTVFYSDLVPTALVVDLQEHLSETASLLEQRTGIEIGQLPDTFLMANREVMDQVGSATGVTVGFEDGYFKSYGARPGIYMRTDLPGTVVRRLLVHEYVHLIFDDLANRRNLPAWLAEGLSGYYEYDIALSGTRSDATRVRLFSAADEARAAARSGGLFSLSSLNSQGDWNTRTDQDQISLQYAEAYMAVRYLNETYGPLSAKDVVIEFGRGFGLPDSIKAVTGLELAVFESQFNLWLQNWEDPERASVVESLKVLQPLLDEQDAILTQRSKNLNTSVTASEAAISRASLVNATQALIVRLQGFSPPETTLAVHQETEEYFVRILVWLTQELNHANTLDDSYRVAANAMIPEINARELLLLRNISSLKFILNLEE